MSKPRLPDDYELKESYEFDCDKCGYSQNAKPSLMMSAFGLNSGCGSCLECGTFLHLEIESRGEFMTSQIWDDYLEAQGMNPS